MPPRETTPAYLYEATVGGAGLAVFAAVVIGGLPPAEPRFELWMLGGLVLLSELLHSGSPRDHAAGGEASLALTFSFAMLLALGAAPAIAVHGAASLAGDAVRRSSLRHAAFHLARHTIPLTAAAGALVLAGAQDAYPDAAPGATTSGWVLAGAALLITRMLLDAGASVAARSSRRALWALAARHGLTDAALLALSPLILLAVRHVPALLPVMTLPTVAVALGGRRARADLTLIERLRLQAAEKEHQALHDALTGLPNRSQFHARAHEAVTAARRAGERCAVLVMNLDHFQEINETLGHHSGDLVLKRTSARLSNLLPGSDTVAHLGGDEFGILLPHVRDADAAARAAERIIESLEEPIPVEDISLNVGSSIGIALSPDHAADASLLMQKAGVAMQAAKQRHRGYELYTPVQDRHSAERLALAGELRHALDIGELVLVFQPKARLDDGGVAGVEALVRWTHPRRGLLGPQEFIPLAEHTGLIRGLTLQVLDGALSQSRRWHDQGLHTHVSVNLSAQSLLDAAFPNEVARLLSQWNVSPAWLELEITESTIMIDPYRALQVLTSLSHMGIRLAIDDYGTGYSSLAYLRQLPVNAIKIDKSFVMGLTSSDNDAVIVRSTIELGRNLGLEVVAEGVETHAIWQTLAELECDVAQGFFLARPMPAADLTHLLQEGLPHPAAHGARRI